MADYSQVETIAAAYLSRDSVLMDIIESGKSQHDITRESVFSSRADYTDAERYKTYRKLAKICNFSLPYGVGVKNLAEQTGCTYEEAKEMWVRYWSTYAGLRDYGKMLQRNMEQNGFILDVFGKAYSTPEGQSYKALNRMIQGTCAGIFKRGALNVYEMLKVKYPDAYQVLYIHDEQIIEVPLKYKDSNIYQDIQEQMQGNFHSILNKPTPLEVSVSRCFKNWNEKEDIT